MNIANINVGKRILIPHFKLNSRLRSGRMHRNMT